MQHVDSRLGHQKFRIGGRIVEEIESSTHEWCRHKDQRVGRQPPPPVVAQDVWQFET